MENSIRGVFECRWTVRHHRPGCGVIWEIVDKKNTLVDTGERAILDTFCCDLASNFFGMTNFWIGLYYGSVSETTVLTTLPGEPASLYGYSRQEVERSAAGWPTVEKHEGDWRRTSVTKTLSISGADIGPVNGCFLCTSPDNTGILVGVLAFGTERTIKSGDTFDMAMKMKLK